MPLEFSPFSDNELDLYMKVCWDSFSPGIMGLMYPKGFSEVAQQHSIARGRRSEAKFPGRCYRFKVVDTDLPPNDPLGGVVGVSHWQIFPNSRSDEDLALEKEWNEKDEAEYGVPPGQDTAFLDAFHGATAALKKKHVGGRPHVFLQALATRTGHSRRGVGAMHLKWGMDRADELGLPAYLEASPEGYPLYKRWGWENLERLDLDAKDWGWDNSLEHWVMWREPKVKNA